MKTETDHPNTGKGRDKSEASSGNGEYLRQSSKTKVNVGRLGRPPRPDAGNVLCTIVFNSRKKKQNARKETTRKRKQESRERENEEKETTKQKVGQAKKETARKRESRERKRKQG